MRHATVLALLAVLLPVSPQATFDAPVAELQAQAPRRAFLFKDSRGELAQARARGESDVLVVLASMNGQNGRVAQAIEAMGGTVQFRDDDVDYLRARVPVDEVEALATHASVHSIDISITGRPRSFGLASAESQASPRPNLLPTNTETAVAVDTVWPPKLSEYPLENRYSPLHDIRAADFREENPTFDGRGVTIAMIDMSPDMLLPELQQAVSLDGEPIPKIAIYQAALDIDEEDDGRWVRMDDMVEASGGTFTYRGTEYSAPRDGVFRIAPFDEAKADTAGVYGNQGLDQDVNRDGNPEGSSREFGVLWDKEAGDVWVDTDQDHDFTDEMVLGHYNDRPTFGVFGTDDPATQVRESIGFGIQIDSEKDLIALNLGIASHASLVVGAAVASRGEEGRFDGVAPGAQLASVAEGGSAYGQTEAVIAAAKNPLVDVIYFEQSSNITRTYLLRDGRLVPSVIYDRLVDRYGPSILSPTHNYPVLGAIDDIVMGRGIIGVGGHESAANFFSNHGVRVEHEDNLLITGGYGPMGDGSLKPDIISPSNYVSTARGFEDGRAIPGLFQLPPGYTIAGGTSTATPTAAGGVGLLISAARQAGIAHDPHALKYAVTRSARWVPHIAAYKQGNGVINVEGAWAVLQELSAGGLKVDIETSAPVRTPYSHLLPTPHEGFGLYERGGWNVGDRGERTLTLTRTSGPPAPMTFDLSLAGNEHGTFSVPLTVTLPLGTPVDLPVTVTPSEFGVHTAHLTLDHGDVVGYAHRTPLTIVAAEPLNAGNDFAVEKEVTVPRPGIQSHFFHVPEGVSALRFDANWSERAFAMSVTRPDTRLQRGESVGGGGGITQVVRNPMPGTWEVRLSDITDTRTFDWEQAKKAEPVPPTSGTLKVTALSVEVAAVRGEGVVTDNGDAPAGVHQAWVENRMAAFEGGVVTTAVGSAWREMRSIRDREQQVFEVEVLPGSTALRVALTEVGDPTADLDVYVFDCTEEECRAVRTDADPFGDEFATVLNPAAGTWKVVVDAAFVPSDDVAFSYTDVVLNQAYGSVGSVDLPQERATGARWTTAVHSWVAPAAHDDGRSPFVGLKVMGTKGDEMFLVTLAEIGMGH